MSEHFKMFVAVNLILIQDGKTLLLRRCNTGWKDGLYSVVAGHVDGNEEIADAVVREAEEEAGIIIKKEDVRVIHVQHRSNPDREYIDFTVTADSWNGEPTNTEPEKCDDLSWFPMDALPENMIPYIRTVFEHVKNGTTFSEWHEPA